MIKNWNEYGFNNLNIDEELLFEFVDRRKLKE